MAALYFILFRKNIHFSLGIILVSFYAYLCCSRLKNTLPLEPAFIIYLLVIVSMAAGFIKRLKSTANEKY